MKLTDRSGLSGGGLLLLWPFAVFLIPLPSLWSPSFFSPSTGEAAQKKLFCMFILD